MRACLLITLLASSVSADYYVYRDSGNSLPDGCTGNYVAEQHYSYSGDYYGDETVLIESVERLDISGKKVIAGQIVDMTTEELEIIEAQEAAQFAAYEAARGEAIAGQASAAITTLAGLLDVFGLSMPLDFQEAMGTMYAASKQDASKTPDALLALITYNGLRESLSDRDIYLAARHLGLTAEQE